MGLRGLLTSSAYPIYFNSRWTAFTGYRATNSRGVREGAIAGATYLLPYLFALTGSIHSAGEARVSVGREIPLTSRLSLLVNAQYDTAEEFAWQAGVSYTVSKRLSLIGSYDADYGLGAGVGFRF